MATLALAAAASAGLRAERVPVTVYGVSDGLPHDHIVCIVPDSRGFLWFCTPEGVARYDGHAFVTYDTSSGLPSAIVYDIVETPDAYWLATAAGLARFDPASARFTRHPLPNPTATAVHTLLRDRSGTVWAGSRRGLFRLPPGARAFEAVDIGLTKADTDEASIAALAEDADGSLWVATGVGVWHRERDGRTTNYRERDGLPSPNVQGLLADRGGRVWAATTSGLALIARDASGRPAIVRRFTQANGMGDSRVGPLLETSNGRIIAGTVSGVSELAAGANGEWAVAAVRTAADGLPAGPVQALGEDRHGNLWVGTESGGAARIARSGLTTYRESEGLGQPRIAAILEDRAGRLCVVGSGMVLQTFDGQRFHATRPRALARLPNVGWGWFQIARQDGAGDWWMATGQGLYRFSSVARIEDLESAAPAHVYTARDGLPSSDIFRVYEDRRGDVWIGVWGPGPTVARWSRTTGAIEMLHDGWPMRNIATAFAEDASGALWVGFYEGGIGRYRDGAFALVDADAGVPPGFVRGLHVDSHGRLWVATASRGVARIDTPTADRVRVNAVYTNETGLASTRTACVTEDARGRIYICTGRGVDGLDVDTGRVKHYGVADGLAAEYVNVGYRDRQGALWFGTLRGLSRLVPAETGDAAAPPSLIGAVRIAGAPSRTSALGVTSVADLVLGPSENYMDVEFLSPSFAAGESIRFQYKLEGAAGDWSAPADERRVTLAGLAPGAYRLLVRAVNQDGVASTTPASVSFRVLPPLWRRWWVLLLTALVAGLAVHGSYAYHERRLLHLERVRTRIAADLHDDIGASLSRIAIMTEVAKTQVGTANRAVAPTLTEVADSARELVTSMSDIVWSVDPRRDDLQSLIQRLRQFTSAVLDAADVSWTFDVPAAASRVPLTPEQRRDLFLILKEAINNAVRHARCRNVSLAIRVGRGQLDAEVSDDGVGFVAAAPAHDASGNGLRNMHARAGQIGGLLTVTSEPGRGTLVHVVVPLRGRMA